MKVYEAVAKAVVDEGVDAIFALMGDANMELLAAVNKLGFTNVRNGLHEGAVVAEAEGYARGTGKTAFTTITCGPGLANTLMSLTEAVRGHTPMVLFTGQPSRDDLGHIQSFDHRAFATLAGAAYQPVGNPGATLDAVRAAFLRASAERIPVLLDIDIDIQFSDFPWDYSYEPSVTSIAPSQRPRPDDELLARVATELSEAEHPVILAGVGAIASGAVDALRTLGERTGALLATTLMARGLFRDTPFNIGISGLFSTVVATELLGEADLVVAFGASLSHYTVEDGYLFPNARTIQFDLAAHVVPGNAVPDLYVSGDAKVSADALLARLGPGSKVGFRTPEVADRITKSVIDSTEVALEPGTADPRAICEELERSLPPTAGVVTGGGHFMAFPIMHMTRRYEPQLYCYYFGAVGQGLPIARGAAAGYPDRPIALVEGDGSFFWYLGELAELAEYNERVLVVILNDGAYGAEYHKLRAHGWNPELGAVPHTDFAAVAQSFGVRGRTLTDASQMAGYVSEFLDAEGPMVVDCHVSRAVVTSPYRRLHFGLDH